MAFRLTHAALVLAVLGVSPVLPAMAEKGGVAAFDPDKDGTIDLKEAQAAAAAAFTKHDPDKDGTLDAKELKGKVTAEQLKAADPDSDGTLDPKEYAALVESAFKAADPDNDGTIDAKELETPAGKVLHGLMH